MRQKAGLTGTGLARPPGRGEITGEGYLSQWLVLARRAALLGFLCAGPPPPGGVIAGR